MSEQMVIICREAEEDSVLAAAMAASLLCDRGTAVTLVFAGGALSALDEGTFGWSADFKDRGSRIRITANAESAGFPFGDRSRDARWSDVRSLVRGLADHSEVRLVGCPLWTQLLGMEHPPAPLEAITGSEYASLLTTATNVIGGYA